ncbi:hypothetical protein PLESTB_001151500 [Pleodorina starrii]|uniref:Pentacotripeptide-repeat region of PRORP domain-containing protein n=1 Tax=Pleodorina starrii TaxID=330485 RepID=A0A9W6BRY1_9CHLO|nr:hypothetical protein PLESTB_001151500 [Pleodorina starrii]GLC68146.1 hypothetical protein PLESTF_000653400 [Pleodorina starrii]
MLSVSSDARQQQVDVPSSPPSTSGRNKAMAAVDDQDRAFLPGSRRRLRNPVSRRNLSTASFYGEYCDLKATQRMVSTIWERLMSGGSPEPEPSGGSGTDPTITAFAEPPEPHRLQQQQQQQPQRRRRNSAVADALTPGSPAGPAASTHSGSGATSRADTTSPTASSPATPTLADGWSVSPAAAAAAPHKRVVLYLGPQFELQLPPPPVLGTAAAGDGTGGGAGGSTDLGPPFSSREGDQLLAAALAGGALVDSPAAADAPKPLRRVRGCVLSTPEVVREVSFGGDGGVAAEEEDAAAGRRRRRGRSKGGRRSAEAIGSTAAAAGAEAGTEAPGEGGGAAKARWRGRQGTLQQAATVAGAVAAGGEAQAVPRIGAASGRYGGTSAAAATVTATAGNSSSGSRDGGSGSISQSPHSGLSPSSPSSDAPGVAALPAGLHRSTQPRQLVRQRDLLEALVGRASDAVVTERIQQLACVNRTGVTAVNFVLQALGDMGHVHALSRLLTLQVALDRYNEHTYATAFKALYKAGRLGMVLGAFQEACRSGRDLGPVACSALLHIASRERNIKLAWQLFDEMVAQQMTLNRYSYNCMAHIAAQYGTLDDARLIYGMMKAEAAGGARSKSGSGSPTGSSTGSDSGTLGRPDCRPDSYTYSALVRSAVNGGRGDLLPALFNEMVATQRAADRAVGRPRPLAPGEGEGRLSKEVWCHFICAASRTGQPDLALRFFHAGLWELCLLPNREVYNVLLGALAKSRPLHELLRLYSEMVNGCLRPVLTRGSADASGGGGGGAATSEPSDDGAAAAAGNNRDGDGSGSGGSAAAVGKLPPPGTVPQPPLVPDAYTFNALLTAAAHHMAELPTLERIRREMARRGVEINTHVGTSLINAYRRTPELTRAAEAAAEAAAAADGAGGAAGADDAAAVDRVVAAAEDVMSELVRRGAASGMSYTCMAALYATAGRPAEALRCVRDMTHRGMEVDDAALQFLLATVEDVGQFGLVEPLLAARQRQQAQRQEAQRQQAAQRRAAPRFLKQQEQERQQQQQWRSHEPTTTDAMWEGQ